MKNKGLIITLIILLSIIIFFLVMFLVMYLKGGKSFDWAIEEATTKKKQDFSRVEFLTYDEGI